MSYSDNLFYGASPLIHKRARELRRKLTPAERVLWNLLRKKALEGFKFRRQHPIRNFIADFYCHSNKLVIELDGSIHDEVSQSEYDKGRTEELKELGITVIRFRNEEVFETTEDVLKRISKYLTP
ncbi:endonuclease domain-containing protein [Algoriphagus sediminis]|uniref:Endonuclease domain-containing protein n=1 Tax=Algoriphagus sediminis TaxID=3057113 RepID=A0ABT7YDX0_9BACT|nr:endonuclease domain-containing protein [Algoriphagus sediminis]MDN3204714.1 endonuclease domain-containing protein [Algoriphagus sediminis]